jgi:hypothetical protein
MLLSAFRTELIRIDRGKGDEVRVLVHSSHTCGPEDWKDVKLMIFDSPSSTELFEQRIAKATEKVKQLEQIQGKSNVEVINSQKCTGFDHLHSILSDVLDKVLTLVYT